MSVLVFIENRESRFTKSAFELISYACRIASDLNTSVTALSIGNLDAAELNKAGTYGASKVLTLQNPDITTLDNVVYTSILEQAVKLDGATVIVMGSGFVGKAIAPRLSARLQAGMVPYATSIPSSYNPITIRKKTFSGKAFTDIEVNTPLCIITLSPNSFGVHESAITPQILEFNPDLSSVTFSTKVESTEKFSGKILLSEADIVVSAGRGMKGPENWGPVEELAEVLGAATACSRPVADEGWRPHAEHVGQTGKVIAPNLYFAFGISGAIQHVAGISSSKVIVAINKDPEAPIFETADYGIVGDVQKVLPELIQAIKTLKAH
ncbi:MAG: electron transfer flavoprotein subunit alpha/FixB family protein [Bacteroidales bacterium]|nr:electron transfer flavoprotein subunit alpha/FixB family protein [Bacteroidales bacterium]